MGFTIKLEWKSDLYDTSFCGMSLTQSLTSMADPRKVMLNFGWTHSPKMAGGERVLQGLLRSKALSLVYEHPRCPIITTLGLRYIALTAGVKPVHDYDWYHKQLEMEAERFQEETRLEVQKGITDDIRADFAQKYKISPGAQLEIERYLNDAPIGPLFHPLIDGLFEARFAGRLYSDLYVSNLPESLNSALADELRPQYYQSKSTKRTRECELEPVLF